MRNSPIFITKIRMWPESDTSQPRSAQSSSERLPLEQDQRYLLKDHSCPTLLSPEPHGNSVLICLGLKGPAASDTDKRTVTCWPNYSCRPRGIHGHTKTETGRETREMGRSCRLWFGGKMSDEQRKGRGRAVRSSVGGGQYSHGNPRRR